MRTPVFARRALTNPVNESRAVIRGFTGLIAYRNGRDVLACREGAATPACTLEMAAGAVWGAPETALRPFPTD